MDDDVSKLDLYEIIGASITSDESEIKKAYRKKALSCHPDKNPDNPKAAELFLQLTKALEILTDVAARAAYDKVVNARAQAKLRVKELDAKRKKFKDDLDAREEAFKRSQTSGYSYSPKSDEEKLKAEIERLKKEGSRLVEEEKERLRQKILEDLRNGGSHAYSEDECRAKIRWKVDADDTTNGGYDYDNLHRFLSKHGEISVLVLSSTKKGRGLVEFKTREAAESAVNYERGLITNPLKLEGMWEKGKAKQQFQTTSNPIVGGGSLFASASRYTNRNTSSRIPQGLSCSSAPDIFNTQSHSDTGDTDLENTVLNNLRRAEERKRLIEEMKAQDEGS